MAEVKQPGTQRVPPSPRGRWLGGAQRRAGAPRIAIERVSPQVDGGRYPARAVAGHP